MWNPFKTPLSNSVRSVGPAEYGYPGQAMEFAREVTLDDADYPDNTGIEGGVSQWRGPTGELFQDTNPEWARPYRPEVSYAPGALPTFTELNPAPGSVDLAFPRDAGGVPGTNTTLLGEGPVTGEDYANWTGTQGSLHRPNPSYSGPVTGGPDYSSQLSAAYFQQQAALYSQEYANSAMVSAV